jgi:topoisomerase IA-like protein
MPKIKYIDYRKITIPYLKNHRLGVDLPSGDNILNVTDSEARHLMKMKNGTNDCWELIRERQTRKDEIKVDEVK